MSLKKTFKEFQQSVTENLILNGRKPSDEELENAKTLEEFNVLVEELAVNEMREVITTEWVQNGLVVKMGEEDYLCDPSLAKVISEDDYKSAISPEELTTKLEVELMARGYVQNVEEWVMDEEGVKVAMLELVKNGTMIDNGDGTYIHKDNIEL